MIQGISSFTGSYLSSTPNLSSAVDSQVASSSQSQSVITIERGSGVYETYMRHGVVQKLQYVGSTLSKSF